MLSNFSLKISFYAFLKDRFSRVATYSMHNILTKATISEIIACYVALVTWCIFIHISVTIELLLNSFPTSDNYLCLLGSVICLKKVWICSKVDESVKMIAGLGLITCCRNSSKHI
jgi:hypothetical protein